MMQINNPPPRGDALPEDVLEGKTFTTGGTFALQTGTLVPSVDPEGEYYRYVGAIVDVVQEESLHEIIIDYSADVTGFIDDVNEISMIEAFMIGDGNDFISADIETLFGSARLELVFPYGIVHRESAETSAGNFLSTSTFNQRTMYYGDDPLSAITGEITNESGQPIILDNGILYFRFKITTLGAAELFMTGRPMLGLSIAKAPFAYPPSPPSPIAWDDFNRPDSLDTLGVSPSGHQWTPIVGSMGIENNMARQKTNQTGSNAVVIETGLSNCKIRAKMTAFTNASRLIFRLFDADNYWLLNLTYSGALTLQRVVDGAFQQITQRPTPPGFTQGKQYEVHLWGETIVVYEDGIEVMSVVNGAHFNRTRHGVGAFWQGGAVDDFEVWEI